jgi:hypothetical protein
MALNANALVTLAEAKDHLNIPALTTDFDARVERYVNAASEAIANHCDRKLLHASYDLRFDGRRSDRVLLPHYPVTSVTALWDDPGWDFLPGTLIPPEEYEFDAECEGEIVLRSRRFSRANQNVRVQFTAGFQSPVVGGPGAPFPATLSYACLLQVEYLDILRTDRRVGVQSKGKQGESISFTNDGMPPQVVSLLANFVRYEPPLSNASTGNY